MTGSRSVSVVRDYGSRIPTGPRGRRPRGGGQWSGPTPPPRITTPMMSPMPIPEPSSPRPTPTFPSPRPRSAGTSTGRDAGRGATDGTEGASGVGWGACGASEVTVATWMSCAVSGAGDVVSSLSTPAVRAATRRGVRVRSTGSAVLPCSSSETKRIGWYLSAWPASSIWLAEASRSFLRSSDSARPSPLQARSAAESGTKARVSVILIFPPMPTRVCVSLREAGSTVAQR